ncbi:Chaperone protein ClpB [Cytospora mali]|uniref:Chaperone protein ClpB n=1 Tax=Cytospora mali TaxID=578113 RepID=A0A194VB27_CYTMA|nr:Chaperone protein ClpB [Valsa mali var. pyri (nom. inval.)]
MASTLPPPPPIVPETEGPAVSQPLHENESDSEKSTNEEVHTPNPDATKTPLDDSLAEWDFTLPHVTAPATLANGGEDGSKELPLSDLIGAIQEGEECESVRKYLAFYDFKVVQAHINDQVEGFPAMFYIVQRRDPNLIRLWVRYGGDVDVRATCGLSKDVPLLATAVALGGSFKNDTTDVVSTLLSLGASPLAIPKAFYMPPTRDLPPEGPGDQEMPELAQKHGLMSWCTPSARALLADRLNYRQRCNMCMSSLLKPHGTRVKQVTRYKDAENLLGVPYFLIGQTQAAQFLIKRLLQHLAKPPNTPLVMVFAGPSGHGKTELARKLGELISLEMEIVDCTNKSDEKEMFGARSPYQGWEKGSPLNNFLARKAGTRCIVFLDEFEKTTEEVCQTLLLPFQNGEYEDRTTKGVVDCSKTIWILATNAFDTTIHDFCKSKYDALFRSTDQTAIQKIVRGLCKTLRTEAISKFGAPLTGRITEFVPFLTFSDAEQAAVTHKYLTEVGKELAKPIVISEEETRQRFVGNIDLQVPKDYSICRIIAKEEYLEQLGARSVINGVRRMIEGEVLDHYLELEGEIREDQGVTTYRVTPNQEDGVEVCYVRPSTTMADRVASQNEETIIEDLEPGSG